jgi:hypothetical protein
MAGSDFLACRWTRLAMNSMGIAVGVLSPLDCFSICLEAATQILQKFGHFGSSCNEVLPPQFSCQCPRALDGLLQWLLGVAASLRYDQFL